MKMVKSSNSTSYPNNILIILTKKRNIVFYSFNVYMLYKKLISRCLFFVLFFFHLNHIMPFVSGKLYTCTHTYVIIYYITPSIFQEYIVKIIRLYWFDSNYFLKILIHYWEWAIGMNSQTSCPGVWF